MLLFWAGAMPIAALLGFPWTYLTKDISFLYNTCMWVAWTGVQIVGVKVQTVGLEKIDPARTYIFMSNHISNLDPPIGDGEEGTFQGPDSGSNHEHRLAGSS